MTRLSLAIGSLLPIVLAGCIGPRPSAPSASLVTPPATWRAETNQGDAPDRTWWLSFEDPVLTRLIDEALARNTDIGQAAARVFEAGAIVRSARAARFPELDLSSSGGYSRTVTLGIPITALGGATDVALSWNADFFGRLSSADAATRAALLSSEASRGAVELAVIGMTAQNYIELLGADARLQVLRETLESRAESLRVARRLTANGYASRLELQEAEGEYEATARLVPQTELEITRLENAVSILTGVYPGAIDRDHTALEHLVIPVPPVQLPSSLLRRRPDIAAAEAAVVAADHTLDSARAAMLPDVSLSASMGAVYADTLTNPLAIFGIGGSVLAPLLDAGRRRANADAKAAQRDQAAFAYRAVVLSAFRDVEDGLAGVSRLDDQREALRRQVAANRERLRIVTRRREIGYASSIDRLDAERQLLSAQLSLTQARTDCLTNAVRLYKALGGGWSAGSSE